MCLAQIPLSLLYLLPMYWAYSFGLMDSPFSEAISCAKSTVATSDNIQATHEMNIDTTLKSIEPPKGKIHMHTPSLEAQPTNDLRFDENTWHSLYLSKAKVPPIPPNRPLSAGIFQDGDDQSYFAEVYLGSERSKMYMLLDTGSSLSWVMGQNCTDPICKSRNTFGAQNSSTLEVSDSPFSMKYGTGSCSGSIARETVSFAGLSIRIPIGIANTVSSEFAEFEIFGILGLSISKSSTPSFIDSILATKALRNNIFGISLSRTNDGNNTGVINFGAPDTSRYMGEIEYHPLIRDGSNIDWEVKMTSAGFSSTQIPMSERVLFDTGTSYIIAPLYFVYQVHALIPGSGTKDNGTKWEVPCDTMVDMVFQLGSNLYSIPPAVWIRQTTTDGKCRSSLYGAELENGKWIFGDVFLKNFYTVFDFDNYRIGIAKVQIPTLLSIQSPPLLEDPYLSSNPIISGPVDPSSTPSPEQTSGPIIPTTHKSDASIRSTNFAIFLPTLIMLVELGVILYGRRLST